MKLQLKIDNSMLDFYRPNDLEILWEQMQDQKDTENIPYWVEIWPSSVVLAKWLLQNKARIRNQNCLDLGCGLGVSTCAAALCGAKITAVDNTWKALCYARYNLKVNGLRNVNWVYMDWNHPAFLPGCFDFILGSDVLYESGFFKPLLYLFGLALAPQSRIWLASPDRSVTRSFWEILKKYHWKTGLLQKTIPKQAQNNNTTIYLWELKA